MDRHAQPYQNEGGQAPLDLETGGRYSKHNLLDGLVPINREIRLWGWFQDLPVEYRRPLGHILHYGFDRDRGKDWTKENWFTAVGYLVTQLLRHGKRGGCDKDPTEYVEGALPLRYSEKGMPVSDIVRQPNLFMIGATV